eukprot:2986895-Rhodomonas_salina.2
MMIASQLWSAHGRMARAWDTTSQTPDPNASGTHDTGRWCPSRGLARVEHAWLAHRVWSCAQSRRPRPVLARGASRYAAQTCAVQPGPATTASEPDMQTAVQDHA